ncbi:hypothetical protein KQI84_10780 [bacterium]|nr:hypothetical protein [bacterium]
MARIQAQIDELDGESTQESLENLSDVNMFFWPGAGVDMGGISPTQYIPVPSDENDWTLATIYSNRRFCKLLHEMAELPKSEAAAAINAELETALQSYRELERREIEGIQRSYVENPDREPLPIGFVIEQHEGEDPPILGYRYKILSLVLLAGSLELDECLPSIEVIVQEAKRQRDGLYESSLPPIVRYQFLKAGSLYSREILATGVLRSTCSSAEFGKLLEASGLALCATELPPYNAALTRFDLPVRSGPLSADFTGGSKGIACASAMDDDQFEALLKFGMTSP